MMMNHQLYFGGKPEEVQHECVSTYVCTEKLFCRIINEKNIQIELFSYAYFSSAINPIQP